MEPTQPVRQPPYGWKTMRVERSGSTSTPGARLDDDETRCAFVLDTNHLSLADRAAIWRNYAMAVVGLCKDVEESWSWGGRCLNSRRVLRMSSSHLSQRVCWSASRGRLFCASGHCPADSRSEAEVVELDLDPSQTSRTHVMSSLTNLGWFISSKTGAPIGRGGSRT